MMGIFTRIQDCTFIEMGLQLGSLNEISNHLLYGNNQMNLHMEITLYLQIVNSARQANRIRLVCKVDLTLNVEWL